VQILFSRSSPATRGAPASAFFISANVTPQSHAFFNQEQIVKHPDGEIWDVGRDGRGQMAWRHRPIGPPETSKHAGAGANTPAAGTRQGRVRGPDEGEAP